MKFGTYLLLAALCLCGTVCNAQDKALAGSGKNVFVLPVHGPIDRGMLYVFRRAFSEAEEARPAAIIIELDTPGGVVTITREIIDWIRSQSARSPVYAFVNKDAISAGAMIALSTQAIYMVTDGTIGDSMPILMAPTGKPQQLDDDHKEKSRSPMRAFMRGLAQENGYDEGLAEAMVDPRKVFKVGERVICPEGELLTLTAKEAIEVIPPNTKPLLATAIVKDMDDLLANIGLPGANVVRFEEQSADRLARWITMLAPLLLAAGVIGIYLEIKTPGFGLPGIAGAVCLGVFLFGHHVAGLAGWEDIALIVIGIVLIMLEILVIPGFGIAGISGIACLVIGMFMALIPLLPDVNPIPLGDTPMPEAVSYVDTALLQLMVSFFLIAILAYLLGKLLPKTSIYNRLVLDAGLANDQGYVASDVEHYRSYLGQEGVARTMLRPAGTAEFGEERLDVVTTGDLIQKGARVRVVQTEGSRVVVEKIEDKPEEA